VVTPGPRVPAAVGQVVTWVDGVPQGAEVLAEEGEETPESPEAEALTGA
jgi:ATP-dependent helicase Lhr and Lhr-like helicase